MGTRKAQILESIQNGEYTGEEVLEDITAHEVAINYLVDHIDRNDELHQIYYNIDGGIW